MSQKARGNPIFGDAFRTEGGERDSSDLWVVAAFNKKGICEKRKDMIMNYVRVQVAFVRNQRGRVRNVVGVHVQHVFIGWQMILGIDNGWQLIIRHGIIKKVYFQPLS